MVKRDGWKFLSNGLVINEQLIKDFNEWAVLGIVGVRGLIYWGLTPQQQPGSYQTTDLRQVTDGGR